MEVTMRTMKITKYDEYCNKIEQGDKVFYVCKAPFNNMIFSGTDILKAETSLLEYLEKSKVHNILFRPAENEVRLEEELDKYYDEVFLQYANLAEHGIDENGEYVFECPFGDGLKFASPDYREAYSDYFKHVENTPSHVDKIEDIARRKMRDANLYLPKKALKPIDGKSEDENDKEEEDSHFLSEKRKAESHKYGGGAGNKRENWHSQYYLSRKSAVAKIVGNNTASVRANVTMPNYISTEEGNPIVQRARGKKLKSKKDQLIHQSPEIYGIDQAADWGR